MTAIKLKEDEASVDFADALDAGDDFLTDVAAFLVVDGAGFYPRFWREESWGEFVIPLRDALSDPMVLENLRRELVDLVCLKELFEVVALRAPEVNTWLAESGALGLKRDVLDFSGGFFV